MDTNVTRIAGLSIQQRPHHALVVLRKTDSAWELERWETITGELLRLNDPKCPVVVDAAAFLQNVGYRATYGRPDGEVLRMAGWDVRAPIGSGGRLVNPKSDALLSNLNVLVASGQLVDDWGGYEECRRDPARLSALLLAAWGATHAVEKAPAAKPTTNLLPHQQAVVDALSEWQATEEPIAVVVGDHRVGKTHAVKAWAEASGLRVETFEPDNASAAKYARCCVSVFPDAARHLASNVVDALHGSRVVLIANVPSGFQDRGRWLVHLVDAIRSGDAPGRVIECRAARVPLSPRLAQLAQIIDPERA